MNLRERAGMDRGASIDRLPSSQRPIDRAPGPWLACYPMFRDALRGGETTFGALPHYAKSVALRRTSIDIAERAIASTTLDDVQVSFIELGTQSLSEAVDDYLGRHEVERGTSHQSLAESISDMTYPLIARPPCLLRPGRHVFIDGWMRFFAYRSRGDQTIPLLAIDWLDFNYRLGRQRIA